ncbi:MAG: hypothetical protein KBG75_07495 [Pseudomonadales bacterium]|nr:hypothetical protein [Pseudomonadales bacterium]
MKLIQAFIHHIRTADAVQALADAGFRNITLSDVKGMLKPLNEAEQDYSTEAGLAISEAKISLVCAESDVEAVAAIIRTIGRIGPNISGWVYISTIDQALPIGGPDT